MDQTALIDKYMPDYHEVERHQTVVCASHGRVYEAVCDLNLTHSPVVRALFALRSVPALFSGSSSRGDRLGLTIEALLDQGFILLAEQPRRELLLGLIGKFWTPTGKLLRLNAAEFTSFQDSGYAKATWNFLVSSRHEGDTLLTTETRVLCTDGVSRRRFSLYWTLIGPFSGLIRKEILRTIKHDAESKALKMEPR